MKDLKRKRIGVVTFPFGSQKSATAGHELFSNFLKILEPLASEMFVITGNFPADRVSGQQIHLQNINRKPREGSSLVKVTDYVRTQFVITGKFIKIAKHVDIVVYYIGGATLLLPVLTAKILRKRIVMLTPGLASQTAAKTFERRLFGRGGGIFSGILSALEYVNFHLADQIAIESAGTIDSLGLGRYRKKIAALGGAPYIDFDLFKVQKRLEDRRNLVGYIGRLSAEKGVLNFARAIPLISKERSDLEFMIGGDGQLRDEIKAELAAGGVKVEFPGWINHDELPKYLNELKLIISPSFTEGGVPTLVLEAMACGTAVMVTPEAGVDVIQDGKNGFVLRENSPEYIAKRVIEVLKSPQFGEVTRQALELVRARYSYESIVEQYRNLLY